MRLLCYHLVSQAELLALGREFTYERAMRQVLLAAAIGLLALPVYAEKKAPPPPAPSQPSAAGPEREGSHGQAADRVRTIHAAERPERALAPRCIAPARRGQHLVPRGTAQ